MLRKYVGSFENFVNANVKAQFLFYFIGKRMRIWYGKEEEHIFKTLLKLMHKSH